MKLELKFYRVYSIPYKFQKFKLNLNLQKKEKEHCWNGPSPFGHGFPGPACRAFHHEAEEGEVFSPVATGELPVKSGRRAAVEWPGSKPTG
jgi:hypothetical protein